MRSSGPGLRMIILKNNRILWWLETSGGRSFYLAQKLGLDADCKPGCLPEFSHGGASVSYRLQGKHMKWSNWWERSLFSEKSIWNIFYLFWAMVYMKMLILRLRFQKQGKLYVNTSAKLSHHHHPIGPINIDTEKMVVRNGCVWRTKIPT
jgi:hypothetical protein